MEVSIIIPALNEAETIGRVIESAWASGASEVIVVDGGSSDGTPEIALKSRCLLVTSTPGRAVQQNAGAARATGEVLLFQHADNLLATDSVSQITQVLIDPKVFAGGFRQRIDAKAWLYRALEWGNAWRVRWLGLVYGDQGIFIRRSTFYQLGAFPEVGVMEDLLLMRSLRGRYRVVLLPGPLIVSPRRWQRHGIIRQTSRNWALLTAFYFGVSPNRLAKYYPRHDSSIANDDYQQLHAAGHDRSATIS